MHDPRYDRLEAAKNAGAPEEDQKQAEVLKAKYVGEVQDKVGALYANNRAGRRLRAKQARRNGEK